MQPHRWQPTRLPRPWDSPGKNTGVGCHFLLQCMKVKSESEVAQSCPTWRPHGLQPTRFLHPWDFPGKSTRVGCHCLLLKDTSFSSKPQDPNNVTPAYFCSLIFLPVFPLSSNVRAESHLDILHLLCDGIRIIVFLSRSPNIFSGGKVCFLPTPALLVVLLEPDSFLKQLDFPRCLATCIHCKVTCHRCQMLTREGTLEMN